MVTKSVVVVSVGQSMLKWATEEFASLTVGCCRTPRVGSSFCELHQKLEQEKETSKTSTRDKEKMTKPILRKIGVRRYHLHGFGATSCHTIKQRSDKYIQRCSRSFGILAAVTNCKVVVTFSEIFRSETLREIISLLCSTIRGECMMRRR